MNFSKTKKTEYSSAKKFNVYNLIILDESGSMQTIKKEIISGFNEVISSIKILEKKFPNQKHFVSFVTFNSLGIKTLLDAEPLKRIIKIDESSYKPDSMTPLYDAIGFSINKLKSHKLINKKCYFNVTILTDGLENDSKEYTGVQIRDLIELLKKDGWDFKYIGTGHDILSAASSISIDYTIHFQKDAESMRNMFVEEGEAREYFCESIESGNKSKHLINLK